MINRVEQLDDNYIKGLPELIRHEYCRVTELMNNGENYGAMMQLKDAAETIIKLYASIGLTEIYRKENKASEETKLLYDVTDKVLSLGDWAGIVFRLVKFDINDNLKIVYRGIIELLDPSGDVSLVEWRNKCLGHGALGYLSDKNYQDTFVKVYESISKFIEDNIGVISKIVVLSENNDCIVEYEGHKMSLYPFLTVEDSKVFFFDSFFEAKSKVELLNYYYGERKIYKKGPVYDAIKRIHDDCSWEKNVCKLSSGGSVEDGVFLYELEEILKNNSYVGDSVKADYVEQWLNQRMADISKGVFWLQMPSGSGKTTAVQQLEKATKTKISLYNTTVKAIYLNNTYNSNIELILQDIDIALTHSKSGKVLLKGSNKPEFDKSNPEVKQEMSTYLNSLFNIAKEQGFIITEKLLLVFDGMDELPNPEEFLEYIPNDDMLDENIYILITSRPVRDFIINKRQLKKLKITEMYAPVIKDTAEVAMMAYISKNMPSLSQVEGDHLFSIAEHNFAYLHFLVAYSSILNLDFNKQIDIKEVLLEFLKYLNRLYGNKNCKKLFLSLYIMANISSGISIKQLSQMLGEEKISFEIIGIMQDIVGLLKIERYRGNVYEINNTKLQEILKESLLLLQFFDYEMELANIISEQMDIVFGNITNRELSLSKEEYSFIYTIFACEFDSFIRMVNYSFTGAGLIILYYMLLHSFEDEYEKMYSNVHLLYDKLCNFCAIQVQMIDEEIKPYEEEEKKYYQMLTALFASERIWIEWFNEKQRDNDIDDIINESSLINSLYEILLAFKSFLKHGSKVDEILFQLFNYRIGNVLQDIQRIYSKLNMPLLEIKYTQLIIERMQETESEAFKPDYSLEYRKLQHIYEKLGKFKEAKRYELLALTDERDKSKLSPEIANLMHIRALSEEFTSLLDALNKEKNEEHLKRIIEIEQEIHSNIIKNTDDISINDYLEVIIVEYSLACLYHSWGDINNNIMYFSRLDEIVQNIHGEKRDLLDTEIILKMITYSVNLIEWGKVNEAEKIIEKYSLTFNLFDDGVFKQSTNIDEYRYAQNCLSIVYYVLCKIRYPERLKDIASAKHNLYEEDILNCDKIIESYTTQNCNLSDINTDFFRLILDKNQLLCVKNSFSKKAKKGKDGISYQFNPQRCRMCDIMNCPARKSPHRVNI